MAVDPLSTDYEQQGAFEQIAMNALTAEKRQNVIKPVRFDEEKFQLKCDWEQCSYETSFMNDFMDHVQLSHMPGVLVQCPLGKVEISFCCKWNGCPFTCTTLESFHRHIYLHAYHTKLKCIGHNTSLRSGLTLCTSNQGNCNTLPSLDELRCAWGSCEETFINIQEYYDHIRYHCEDQRSQKGPIICRWIGCKSSASNVTKLKDHMRSHTQEKLLACPTCGSMFSNRTRYVDHCTRQVVSDDSKACEVCGKAFSTERLLREHVRSHINMYRCNECDMTCCSLSSLSQHVRYRHSQERPFECSYCEFRAKLYTDLIKHYRIHEDVYFTCTETGCTYKTKTQTTLQNHINKCHCSSTEYSKFACHICDKRYLKGAYLTDHLKKLHSLEWPPGHSRFRYTVCEDGFYRLNNVRYEMGIIVEPAEHVELQPDLSRVEDVEPMEKKLKLEVK